MAKRNKKKQKNKKLRRERWTAFEDVTDDLKKRKPQYFATGGDRCYVNSRYEVTLTFVGADDEGNVINNMTGALWLSIKRRDRVWIRDWRELQRIKNEIAGPEREACELYPAESRLVDTSNQFHLWVLPEGQSFPWGYKERLVMEDTSGMRAKQRQFEDEPEDLRTPEQEIADTKSDLVERYGETKANSIIKSMGHLLGLACWRGMKLTETERKKLKLDVVPTKEPKGDELFPVGANCHACAHAYMEPSGEPLLICGVEGGFGTNLNPLVKGGGRASETPVCGADRPKFKQHPLRNPDGSLKKMIAREAAS